MAVSVLSACSNTAEKANTAEMKKKAMASAEAAMPNNNDLYISFYDGRMNVFYDGGLYKKFLEHGETAYRRTFIGAGPNGETISYGLTGKDKKKCPKPEEERVTGEQM